MSDHPIPSAIRKQIIERLVKPDMLTVKTWPREIRLINQLTLQYPDPEFWLKHDLSFMLNSLAYFKSADGGAVLKTNYSVFHFSFDPPTEPPNSVDKHLGLGYSECAQIELTFAPEA